jgi:hypothetical protein
MTDEDPDGQPERPQDAPTNEAVAPLVAVGRQLAAAVLQLDEQVLRDAIVASERELFRAGRTAENRRELVLSLLLLKAIRAFRQSVESIDRIGGAPDGEAS